MSAVDDTDDNEELIEELPDELEEERKEVRPKNKLYSYPADFTLEVHYDHLKSGEIVVPPFQRKYVWTKKASMLIGSFMRSLPVPPVYLFTTER